MSELLRPLTVADLEALPSDLPSGPVRYELDNGRLVIMPPPGDIHGASQSNFAAELKIQGERKGLGKARTEVAVILRRNPDRVVGPDDVFITNASLPIKLSPEGYLETIPELIVEVRSKNDTDKEVQSKVDEYIQAGVKVVLEADPKAQTITIHRPKQAPQVLGPDDFLTVEDIIPGFSVKVREVLQA